MNPLQQARTMTVTAVTTKRDTSLRSNVHHGTEIVDNHFYLRSNTNNHKKHDDVFTIAVHIRRGDVDPCTYMNRYLPNEYYLRLIKKFT